MKVYKVQGPVVQNILVLTSSLRGQFLSVLGLYNQIYLYLLLKNERSFSHFFNKNIGVFEILKIEIIRKC